MGSGIKFLFLNCFLLILLSCTGNSVADKDELDFAIMENAPGDSTLYGLACEGCNDSVVVVLPYDLSNPQTYDITLAWKKHNIFGMPEVGDNIAVILCKDDSTKAEKVIVPDKLTGTWYYDIKPSMHKPAALTDAQFKLMKTKFENHLTDSVRNAMLKPLECELTFNSNKTINMTGMRQIKEMKEQSNMLLIDYKHPIVYKDWTLWNGKILMTQQRKNIVDTFEILSLRKDSMKLSSRNCSFTLHKKINHKE